jgi:hypothetical protein
MPIPGISRNAISRGCAGRETSWMESPERNGWRLVSESASVF